MSPSTNTPEVVATRTFALPPEWALLQRQLFVELDLAWRVFADKYCEPDGRLRYDGLMFGRDGADDFYEPFFNWPILYMLGGSDDILAAAKRSWEGVTAQLAERGFLEDEFDRGYDWFHQGESSVFFYALCAADPDDAKFRERALRFANFYLPGAGIYDAEANIIRAPHNGGSGARPGLGENWESYSADQTWMEIYGLPLHGVAGIEEWADLHDVANARSMGDAMQQRMGVGDTAVNLAATALVANAWLYDNDPGYSRWIREYVAGWRERASANYGLLPDNVGPDGKVGALHHGRWYGGLYGWTWPHGFFSVESAAVIAVLSDQLVNGSEEAFDMARVPLDAIMGESTYEVFRWQDSTLGLHWVDRIGEELENPIRLMPYRFGDDGWFDRHPMHLAYPVWIWWASGAAADLSRLKELKASAGYDWKTVRQFRDKEEAGHEAPWLTWLMGENSDWPEQALLMARQQVKDRLQKISEDPGGHGNDIHWWQGVNPVVTEVLTQQISGAPAALYNGGLPLARLRYWDAETGKPGLPHGVAALVVNLSDHAVTVRLVNLSTVEQRSVLLQAGAFGEDLIESARADAADPRSVGASRMTVALPARSEVELDLTVARRHFPARHSTSASPR